MANRAVAKNSILVTRLAVERYQIGNPIDRISIAIPVARIDQAEESVINEFSTLPPSRSAATAVACTCITKVIEDNEGY